MSRRSILRRRRIRARRATARILKELPSWGVSLRALRALKNGRAWR
jgi:hypothetical protein